MEAMDIKEWLIVATQGYLSNIVVKKKDCIWSG